MAGRRRWMRTLEAEGRHGSWVGVKLTVTISMNMRSGDGHWVMN